MIQRIQTLYLLLVVILFAVLFFLPLAFVQTIGGTTCALNVCTLQVLTEPVKTISVNWLLSILGTAIFLLSIFTIFLYEKRNVQKWLCILNMLLMLAFIFYAGYNIVHVDMLALPKLEVNNVAHPTVWALIPVIAFILNLLAIRRIAADEKLIRSLDRIR